MEPDLVILAQHGDKGAFGLIAAGIADRFLAVSRRILRDIDLAEDATQQALLAIWQPDASTEAIAELEEIISSIEIAR